MMRTTGTSGYDSPWRSQSPSATCTSREQFHDIVPADDLGIRSVWITRLGEGAQPTPTRELPDLHWLADMLDELVP